MTITEKTLRELHPGQSGIICSVGNQSGAVKRRLVDMGLTPGTAVAVRRIAPLGDPIEIRLRGYELSLRREDAAQVLIGDRPPRVKSTGRITYGYGMERADPRLRHPSAGDAGGVSTEAGTDHGLTATIALVGNPNSGKTTLYNALTGSNQYVGNWPGVTVEKKEGISKLGGREVKIIDLPGVYALSPYSMEEIIARNCLLGTGGVRPDAVINIVDATNIERNLYLTVQLLELGYPTVMALSFMDESQKNGDVIDTALLSASLGIPVVPISAKTGENLEALLDAARLQVRAGFSREPDGLHGGQLPDTLGRISRLILREAEAVKIPARWAALKLVEGDGLVPEALNLTGETKSAVERLLNDLSRTPDNAIFAGCAPCMAAGGGSRTPRGLCVTEPDSDHGLMMIADDRYRYIEKLVHAAVRKGSARSAETLTDRIDRIATHRILAVPVFLALMLVIFAATFGPVGKFLQDGVAFIVGNFSGWLVTAMKHAGTMPWAVSLLTDGIIRGVGGVLNFLPQIALLFFFLSLLEDSGYMARAAFITDRLLHRFGLSGKSFIPMLMGFGCTVPAVMGARTMENEKDRRMTILLVPFMSCSAKLPVYGLISAAFFGVWAGPVVFSLYVLGMAMAVATGIIFRRTLFAGPSAPFVMELPPYRLPSLGNLLTHVWDRVRGFLIRAGTLIFIMSVVLWFLMNYDGHFQMVTDISNGILAKLGTLLTPVFSPLGFGLWQASVALLTGLVAKETIVASLSLLYGFSLTTGGLATASAMTGFTPLAAFAYLVFILLYIPCVAAVSTMYRELGSLKWTAFSIGWQLAVAYVVSMAVYQVGRLAGL